MPKPVKTISRAKTASMPKVMSRPKNAKTATINLRIEPSTKLGAEKIFGALGLSMSDGISMFLKQVVHTKGIPFELRVPNQETRRALREAMANTDMTHYATPDDMWRDLLK
jgi:DNA-damage-inducible protein J